jgi:hypothetical protein
MFFDIESSTNQLMAECGHLEEGIYWCKKLNAGKITNEEILFICRDNSEGSECLHRLTSIINNGSGNIVLYPNPANDYFDISLSSNFATNDLIIQVTDTHGKLIREIETSSIVRQIRVMTSGWVKGVYFVNFYSDSKIIKTLSVVIQ